MTGREAQPLVAVFTSIAPHCSFFASDQIFAAPFEKALTGASNWSGENGAAPAVANCALPPGGTARAGDAFCAAPFWSKSCTAMLTVISLGLVQVKKVASPPAFATPGTVKLSVLVPAGAAPPTNCAWAAALASSVRERAKEEPFHARLLGVKVAASWTRWRERVKRKDRDRAG